MPEAAPAGTFQTLHPGPPDMDGVRAHGRAERIGAESFFKGQEFLYRLVKALSGGGAA